MNNYNVLISKEEYDELEEASRVLDALLAAGVDNWEGYALAMESLDCD